jgi:hypothetical protein
MTPARPHRVESELILLALMASYAVPRQLTAPAHLRALGIRRRPSRCCSRRTSARQGARERCISKINRERVIQHTTRAGGRHGPAVRAAVLIEPGGNGACRVPRPAAGTAMRMRTGNRRSATMIISRELPGMVFLVRSPSLHSRFAVSSRLGVRLGLAMFGVCVAVCVSPPMSARSGSSS